MTFRECITQNGIIINCKISGSRWGTYEIHFENSETGEKEFVTFDVVSAGTKCGDEKCEELFKEFCKDEGVKKNRITEVYITRAFESMTGYGKI